LEENRDKKNCLNWNEGQTGIKGPIGGERRELFSIWEKKRKNPPFFGSRVGSETKETKRIDLFVKRGEKLEKKSLSMEEKRQKRAKEERPSN